MSIENEASAGAGRARACVELLLAVTLWASSFALMKTVPAELDHSLAVLLRSAPAVLVLGVCAAARRDLSLPSLRELPVFAALGLIGVDLVLDLQFWAMQHSAGAASANWIISAGPVLTALLGRIFLRETLTVRQCVGMAAAASGVLIVAAFGTKETATLSFGGAGDAAIVISALAWSALQISSRKFMDRARPAHTIFWMYAFALVFQLCYVLARGADLAAIAELPTPELLTLIYLGVFCSGAAYMFWYDGLAALPVARVTSFQYVQPIMGAAFAYIFAGERFTPYIIAGGAIVLLGLREVNRGRR